jgi:hypothetical protein
MGVAMRQKLVVFGGFILVLVILVILGVFVGDSTTGIPCNISMAAEPIPQDDMYGLVTEDMKYIRNPDYPEGYQNPLSHLMIPQNPFMASNEQSNNMHCDTYMTDTYEVSGPLGINPQVVSASYGFAECATITFDSKGRIVTVVTDISGPRLLLMDPDTLDEFASFPLPPRHAGWVEDPIGPLEDPSGGAYFCLDNHDRAIVATHNHTVKIIRFSDDRCEFELVREYDLSDHVVPKQLPERDKVGSVLPDWEGRLWYVTRYGMVGVVDPDSGEINTLELTGEEIQNSFTVGEDGVYIISDYAMYRFHADEDGAVVQDWRTEYDRGTHRKVGMINHGSGTTPNLFGDMVAIGDNADPRMNILFLERSSGELVCSIPVFDEDLSCTENALIGLAREGSNGTEYSVIIENNYGYKNFGSVSNGKSTVGGVTRIDALPDGSGGYICKEIWESDEISCTPVPKLSMGNGLIYLYTKEPRPDKIDAWYFTAVDFETGETVFKVLTGTGPGYNNNYAPLTLGPDGMAYVGTLNGMISVRDTTQ